LANAAGLRHSPGSPKWITKKGFAKPALSVWLMLPDCDTLPVPLSGSGPCTKKGFAKPALSVWLMLPDCYTIPVPLSGSGSCRKAGYAKPVFSFWLMLPDCYSPGSPKWIRTLHKEGLCKTGVQLLANAAGLLHSPGSPKRTRILQNGGLYQNRC